MTTLDHPTVFVFGFWARSGRYRHPFHHPWCWTERGEPRDWWAKCNQQANMAEIARDAVEDAPKEGFRWTQPLRVPLNLRDCHGASMKPSLFEGGNVISSYSHPARGPMNLEKYIMCGSWQSSNSFVFSFAHQWAVTRGSRAIGAAGQGLRLCSSGDHGSYGSKPWDLRYPKIIG